MTMSKKLTKKQREMVTDMERRSAWDAVAAAENSMKLFADMRQTMEAALLRLADADLLSMMNEYTVDFEKRKPTVAEVEEYAELVRRRVLPDGAAWPWRLRLFRGLRERGLSVEEIAQVIPAELILKEDKQPRMIHLELPADVWQAWKRVAGEMSLEGYIEQELARAITDK